MARCKKECGLCKQFDPHTRFEGICKVNNRKRKISKKCVKTRFFEPHPDGRKRNLREESNDNEVRLKSRIHAEVPGEAGIDGEAPREGEEPVQGEEGNTPGSTGAEPEAEVGTEPQTPDGDSGSEPVLKPEPDKKATKKSKKKKTKKK